MSQIPGTCLGVSGFFLRTAVWKNLSDSFEHFVCIDEIRDSSECTLGTYLEKAMQILAASPCPHWVIGHSFGGYLARLIAQRVKVERLILLSGLVVQKNQSALEAYQESGQNFMSQLCELDFATEQLVLKNRKKFEELNFNGVLNWPQDSFGNTEPLSIVMNTANVISHFYMPTDYVIPEQDQITDPNIQERFARSINANTIRISGAHSSPLYDIRWLKELVKL